MRKGLFWNILAITIVAKLAERCLNALSSFNCFEGFHCFHQFNCSVRWGLFLIPFLSRGKEGRDRVRSWLQRGSEPGRYLRDALPCAEAAPFQLRNLRSHLAHEADSEPWHFPAGALAPQHVFVPWIRTSRTLEDVAGVPEMPPAGLTSPGALPHPSPWCSALRGSNWA